MTNINGIQKMVVGSKEYENIMKMMGERNGSKVDDEQTLFQTMQYYEMTNCSDNWSADAQELTVEDLIKLWKDFDKEDTSFAKDFYDFSEKLSNYKKEEPDDPNPPEDEDIVRPYIPNPDLTDGDKKRLSDFDYMRANDIHAKLDQEGDYELLLEYARQREGTSFLVPSDYNSDGTVNDKGKAKEQEMIAKLAELDTAGNTLGNVLNEFLEFYEVEEPTGEATNGTLPDAKGDITGVNNGASQELTIGDNKYLITNNGDSSNKLAYEVKTNEKDQKYIEMKGDNWRIQDISGKLQDDLIQMIGKNNELDLGLGDDIAHLMGDNNRALMGDGNDKVYIEGENNFTDMWRGDDQMFNINSDNTTGIGFTGDDEFYSKGDGVLVNGESNDPTGDGLYQDGITTKYDIERNLERPSWFPEPDPTPPDDPTPPGGETTEDGTIEFDGVRYYVYKKFDMDATDKIVYYKADDGRTVFEADGWSVTVIGAMNDTGDKNYANVIINGNRNTYFGSNDNDKVEIRGDKNNIHGDTSYLNGGDDEITIASGTGNYVYGEDGTDSVNTNNNSGNFFNGAVKDVETEKKNTPVDVKPISKSVVFDPSKDADMKSSDPAYALTDNNGKDYHDYTMHLLNAAGGSTVNSTDLAKFGVTTAADLQNKEIFEKLREGSDLVELVDSIDDKVETSMTNRVSLISAKAFVDMYNSCVNGENKDKSWAENMKKLCTQSGMIDVQNNVATYKMGFTNLSRITAADLFKIALHVVDYPKDIEEDEEEA